MAVQRGSLRRRNRPAARCRFTREGARVPLMSLRLPSLDSESARCGLWREGGAKEKRRVPLRCVGCDGAARAPTRRPAWTCSALFLASRRRAQRLSFTFARSLSVLPAASVAVTLSFVSVPLR